MLSPRLPYGKTKKDDEGGIRADASLPRGDCRQDGAAGDRFKDTHQNEDPRGLTGKGNAANENTSIHYELEGRSREEIREYGSRIVHDLLLRDIDFIGTTSASERRTLLRNSLIQEFTYRKLQEAIAHGETGNDNALFLLINAVPCILHMENRIGIKILTRLFMKGPIVLQAKLDRRTD